jgi:hypothetical protein
VFRYAGRQAAYEELKAKGVEFISARGATMGIGAVFKDNSGNWFSLSQHPGEDKK